MSAAARANSSVASHTSHSSIFPHPFHLPQAPPLIAPPHISPQHFLYLQQQQRRLQLVQSLPIPQPLLHQSAVSAASALPAIPPAVAEARLPAPAYDYAKQGAVMTPEQIETLRRQISVYSTICHQLVAMHQSLTAQHAQFTAAAAAGVLGHLPFPYDHYGANSSAIAAHPKTRQRWTPQPAQLQILEGYFSQSTGTPNKARIREITAELQQHGSISETNVYNWFQNRKARAKRKNSNLANGGSGGGEKDVGAGEGGGAAAAGQGAGGKGSAGTGWGGQGEKRQKGDSGEKVRDVIVEEVGVEGEMGLVRSGSVASSGGGDVSKEWEGKGGQEGGEGSGGVGHGAGGSPAEAGGLVASGEGGMTTLVEGQGGGAEVGGNTVAEMVGAAVEMVVSETIVGADTAMVGFSQEGEAVVVSVGGGMMAVAPGAGTAAAAGAAGETIAVSVGGGSLPIYIHEGVETNSGSFGDVGAAMTAAAAAAASGSGGGGSGGGSGSGGGGGGDGSGGSGGGACMDMGDSGPHSQQLQQQHEDRHSPTQQQHNVPAHVEGDMQQAQADDCARLDSHGQAHLNTHLDNHLGTHLDSGVGVHVDSQGQTEGPMEAQSHMRGDSSEHMQVWGAHVAVEGAQMHGHVHGLDGHGSLQEHAMEQESRQASLAPDIAPEGTPGPVDAGRGNESIVHGGIVPKEGESGSLEIRNEAGQGEQREQGGAAAGTEAQAQGQTQVQGQQAGQAHALEGQSQPQQEDQQQQQQVGVEQQNGLDTSQNLAAALSDADEHRQDSIQQQQQQQETHVTASLTAGMVSLLQQGESSGMEVMGITVGGKGLAAAAAAAPGGVAAAGTAAAIDAGVVGEATSTGTDPAAAAAGASLDVTDAGVGGVGAAGAVVFSGVEVAGMGSEVGGVGRGDAQGQQHMIMDPGVFHPAAPPGEAASAMQVMINGKPWDVPIGLLDVRNSFGDGAVIFDSQGCPVPTSDMGITLLPLQEGSSYTVQGGDIALVSDPVPLLPDGDDLVPDSTLL